jgi:hypothetical protein
MYGEGTRTPKYYDFTTTLKHKRVHMAISDLIAC